MDAFNYPEPIPAFRASKSGRTLRCDLLRDARGFELRLWDESGELRRSQVSRTSDEMMSVFEYWRDKLTLNGWTVETL